jgi:hypothetical protein
MLARIDYITPLRRFLFRYCAFTPLMLFITLIIIDYCRHYYCQPLLPLFFRQLRQLFTLSFSQYIALSAYH